MLPSQGGRSRRKNDGEKPDLIQISSAFRTREGAPLGRDGYVELQIRKPKTNGSLSKQPPFQRPCVGRRPSTDGPPWNYRQDEPRGGTPSGSLIDYQFDGITVGYHINDKVALRMCYGQGYESGFGNGNLLKTPADRLKDVHFFGGNFDLYTTDKTFIQSTIARAWNVTDGFNGLTVLPNNPLTGDPVQAPVIMRFTPSSNLGTIDLYGLNDHHYSGRGEIDSVSQRSGRPLSTFK